MKYILLLLCIALTPFDLTGQSRESEALPSVIFDDYTIISSANGWAKNRNTGKWVKNLNQVSDRQHEMRLSLLAMNFDSLMFNSLVITNDTIHILFINKIGGKYRYPSIKEGWYEQKIITFIAFDQTGIDKMKNLLTLPEEKVHLLEAIFAGEVRSNVVLEHSEREVLMSIQKAYTEYKTTEGANQSAWAKKSKREKKDYDSYAAFRMEKRKLKYLDFPISSQVVEGAHVLRFGVSCVGRYGKKDALQERYFEVPTSDWSSLMKNM